MSTDVPSYADWSEQSAVPQARLTPAHRAAFGCGRPGPGSTAAGGAHGRHGEPGGRPGGRATRSGRGAAAAAAGIFFAPTQYAGAFRLWPDARDGLATATDCFAD